MAAFMFKYKSNKVPYNLSQYFTLTSDIYKLYPDDQTTFKVKLLQNITKRVPVDSILNEVVYFKYYSNSTKICDCR